MNKFILLFILSFFRMAAHAQSPAPVVAFSVSAGSVCAGEPVHFTDLSTGSPTSWNWTFQGGAPATSTLQNPVVTFTAAGNVAVILKAVNAAGAATKGEQKALTVTECVDIRGNTVLQFTLFPNPVDEILSVTSNADGFYEVINVIGQSLATGMLSSQQKEKISTQPFNKGVYFLKVRTVAGNRIVKFVKE